MTTSFIRGHYYGSSNFVANTAVDRVSVLSPSALQVQVGTEVPRSLQAYSAMTLNVNTTAHWDTTSPTNYTTAANRAGLNFFVYACHPTVGSVPKLLLSANATYPSGYTADTSRKIGGFHCLCVSVGTISSHPLSGFIQGDVLPASLWSLNFRAESGNNAGMAYVDALDEWWGIYLQSGTKATTASVYGATITDTRMWNDHVDDARYINCRLPDDAGFQIAAEGSNQQTSISSGADPVTTGGHSDTAGRRMISNYGLEDCCGAQHQWLSDQSYQAGSGGVGWKNVVGGTKGQLYLMADGADVKLFAGGNWADASSCGSRSRTAYYPRWYTLAGVSARFVCKNQQK